MDTILLNRKTIRKNKGIRKLQREAMRAYGKREKGVTNARIGKVIRLQQVEELKTDKQINENKIDNADELISLLTSAELTGMSGSDFPTADKIRSFLNCNTKERILVVNGVECEPGLLHDEWLTKRYYEEIVETMNMLKKILQIDRELLAVKFHSEREENRIELCHVPANYPMGEEHILLQQLLDKEIPVSELPVNYGILVLNVQSVYQIYRIWKGIYDKGRYVTLANLEDGQGVVTYVKEGTDICETISNHFNCVNKNTIYVGHGIMAAHPVSEGEVFTAGTCFVAIGTPVKVSNENACKGCGRCAKFCPAGIEIKKIVKMLEKDANADLSGMNLEKCFHCNNCTYVCKAEKNIMSYWADMDVEER